MVSNPIPVTSPLRTAPTAPEPTVASVNPYSTEPQEESDIPRAVNISEKVENPSSDQGREKSSQNPNLAELTPDEQRILEQLKARDREVRAHEQAHLSAAGNLATSGASFTYQKGPDGQRYATGGEVGIDSARVPGDPEATIERAQKIQRAALAPASPSAQDRSVAARAAVTEQKAQAELAQQVKQERAQSAVSLFNNIAANYGENKSDDSRADSVTAPVDTFA